jgi:hypothetical protein
MATSSAAPKTRLIVVLPTGKHRRVVAEIRTTDDGHDQVAVTCWRDTASGPRQVGRSTFSPVVRASRIPALVEAVKQALLNPPR